MLQISPQILRKAAAKSVIFGRKNLKKSSEILEGLIKGLVRIIDEKKLAHFTALCSAWDCIYLKIQMLGKLFQVCSFSFISSV